MELFDGPIDQAPVGFAPCTERRRMVTEALADLELGAWDVRMVSWLAGWDCATVAVIVSWLWRVRRAAGPAASRRP